VRFYDLARDPIVCPACGARNTAVATHLLELGERAVSKGSKTAWRSKPFTPAKPVLPVEPDPAPEIVADADETPAPSADEDTVLEPESDEDDVTEWIDHDGKEPRDT